MVNSAISTMDPMQSEQTGKALDRIPKGMDLYSVLIAIFIILLTFKNSLL